MLTENFEIIDKIDQLQEHFFNYLFSKPVRDITNTVQLPEKDWDYIKSLRSERAGMYIKRSYKIEEIYQLLIPFVKFIVEANDNILPNLSYIVESHNHRLSLSPQEKQVRSMLVDNYNENIYLLGDIILDLYELTVSEDIKINSDKTPLCLTIKEIQKLETDLKFIEDRRKH